LSTLHANDSAGAIARLIDMEVEPFLVASSLMGIISQRLLRTVCARCACPYIPSDELLERLGLNMRASDLSGAMKGAGCEQCGRSGYKGRTGIYEVLKMDEEIRNAIIAKMSSAAIRKIAVGKGMKTLRDDALAKLKSGQTTMEEVIRVTTE
jgi:type II secretory ATPase GspE/PulE/Tfp pilus assembly ATPase PilB-like protein